jgi:hypothetical protein
MSAICIRCDIQFIIGRAKNSMYNNKSWHVHKRYNIARYFFSNEIIFIDHVKSNDNIADLLTKDVIREKVDKSS